MLVLFAWPCCHVAAASGVVACNANDCERRRGGAALLIFIFSWNRSQRRITPLSSLKFMFSDFFQRQITCNWVKHVDSYMTLKWQILKNRQYHWIKSSNFWTVDKEMDPLKLGVASPPLGMPSSTSHDHVKPIKSQCSSLQPILEPDFSRVSWLSVSSREIDRQLTWRRSV